MKVMDNAFLGGGGGGNRGMCCFGTTLISYFKKTYITWAPYLLSELDVRLRLIK